MIRIECWETLGGYWMVVQEVIVEPDKPSTRTRLGHVAWASPDGRKLTGMDMLADVAEHALDLAYGLPEAGHTGAPAPD